MAMENLESSYPAVEQEAWLAEGYAFIRESERAEESLLGPRTAFIKKLLPTDEDRLIDTMTTAHISDLLAVTDQLVHVRGSHDQLNPAVRLRTGLFLAGARVRTIAGLSGQRMSGVEQEYERRQLVDLIWHEDPSLPQATRSAVLGSRYEVMREFLKQYRRSRNSESLPPPVQYSVPQLFEALERGGRIDATERELLERHFLDRETGLSDKELLQITPILADFQQRAALRRHLYESDRDARKPPRKRAASLLGHIIGASINSMPPVSRAQLIKSQDPSTVIKHEEDDKLLAYGLQWLLMKPQPYDSQ